MWGALSDERACLSFTIAAGPRQRSHSLVRVPWDERPYFTVSDSRLPFSSATTRRVTVEVFDPASTRFGLLSCFRSTHVVHTWVYRSVTAFCWRVPRRRDFHSLRRSDSCAIGLTYRRLFTLSLLSSGWFLACDWLALYSSWAVPTHVNPVLEYNKPTLSDIFAFSQKYCLRRNKRKW
jgi:hypothetical protein